MRWISIILYKEFWLLLLYLIPGKVKTILYNLSSRPFNSLFPWKPSGLLGFLDR